MGFGQSIGAALERAGGAFADRFDRKRREREQTAQHQSDYLREVLKIAAEQGDSETIGKVLQQYGQFQTAPVGKKGTPQREAAFKGTQDLVTAGRQVPVTGYHGPAVDPETHTVGGAQERPRTVETTQMQKRPLFKTHDEMVEQDAQAAARKAEAVYKATEGGKEAQKQRDFARKQQENADRYNHQRELIGLSYNYRFENFKKQREEILQTLPEEIAKRVGGKIDAETERAAERIAMESGHYQVDQEGNIVTDPKTGKPQVVPDMNDWQKANAEALAAGRSLVAQRKASLDHMKVMEKQGQARIELAERAQRLAQGVKMDGADRANLELHKAEALKYQQAMIQAQTQLDKEAIGYDKMTDAEKQVYNTQMQTRNEYETAWKQHLDAIKAITDKYHISESAPAPGKAPGPQPRAKQAATNDPRVGKTFTGKDGKRYRVTAIDADGDPLVVPAP